MAKQKIDPKLQTAQEFLNVWGIANNFLYSHDGYIYGYLSVRAKSEGLMSGHEKEVFFSSLTSALEADREAWQLLSIPRTLDTHSLLHNLMHLRQTTNDDARLNLINGEIAAIQEMARNGAKEPMLVLKLWAAAGKRAEENLNKRITMLCNNLSRLITVKRLEDREITFLCKVFGDLCVHQDADDADEDAIPVIVDKRKKATPEIDEAALLQNLITPVGGLSFKVSQTYIGSVVGRIYGVVRFPSSLDYGWATDIMNCTEAITCITFNPENSNELANALSDSINRNLREAETTRNHRERQRYERQAKDADALISKLDSRHEVIGIASIVTMPFTAKEDELDDVCARVISLFGKHRIKLKALGQLQKEAFMQLSPYHIPQPIIQIMLNRIMPLYTLLGGSPMVLTSFRDDKGYYFAKTKDGSVITLNRWHRGDNRTNSNMVFLGKPGTGKSTAVKHIIQTDYMCGVKILIIDPESEYKDLCKKCGGVWLDAGGGGAMSNIFQIKPVPRDDEDKDDIYAGTTNDLAAHIKTLEIFLDIYLPGLTTIQWALLKQSIIELYSRFGITWDTDVRTLRNTDYPIFSDLYALLKEKAKTDNRFEDLASLFYDIAEGTDSFLWNGHTNIDLNSNFICLDTNSLNNASDRIKSAQYFNLLTLCWEITSRDRSEPVSLVCDESYLLVDRRVPQSLTFLRNFSKRCRKYEGSLILVTHSVVGFLDVEVKLYGQELLDNTTYRVFFGTDGKNLKETAQLFDFTEMEQNILMMGARREALVMLGNQRMHVVFELPEYKLKAMGTAGGR